MNALEPLPAISQLRFRAPSLDRDDWLFNGVFLGLLFVATVLAQVLLAMTILPPPPPEIVRPEAILTTLIVPPEVPKPKEEKKTPPKAIRKVKPGPTKKQVAKAPPAVSAPGSPKLVPEIKNPPKDLSKLVVKKGLLGLLSSNQADASLRGFTPTDKRVPSDNLALALAKPDKNRRKEDDLLGPGNYVDVAKKGADVGYLINATKLPKTVNKESLAIIDGEDIDIPVEVLGEGSATGGRSAGEISKWVAKFLGGLRYLYNQELRSDPSLQGKLTVSFEILPDGHVSNAKMVGSSLASQKLNRDLMARIGAWKFPSIEEPVTVEVTYPFLFLPPT